MTQRAALERLPVRGPAARELGLPLPPPGAAAVGRHARRGPLLHGLRPLKRWRYVAAFGPDLMLCAGDARIGPLPQRWWALCEQNGSLLGRTSGRAAGLSMEPVAAGAAAAASSAAVRLRIVAPEASVDITIATDAVEPVEVVSPSGAGDWIFTRKLAGLPARGVVRLGGRRREVELEAVVDDSAGYHERHTSWRWSTGVGRAESGERVAWNLVAGLHDGASASERTLWVDGRAAEVGPARFAEDLSAVDLAGGRLGFSAWATREHRANLVLLRSRYRQPFGTFTGELPGGLELAEGQGVMEEHDVHW